ncbi:helix-turn-helix domain-containing protein [Limnohabitans sp. B9-3]|uniref:helix-turn-helix domain-containing protein n=1 Tax=Limnohabitans sp. B9-3 TaxID=1100707 RepID=UPI000C1DFDA9|nr:helix-turn-helix transcriptional regulator [Limnohabitans sp. B9-3]PIT76547.1 transcriptional regulator [Limnohabitans sp. B9-3]
MLVALGKAIKVSRAQLGISQEALAVDADLGRSYLGGIERGEHNLTIINLAKISHALGISPSNLLQKAKH